MRSEPISSLHYGGIKRDRVTDETLAEGTVAVGSPRVTPLTWAVILVQLRGRLKGNQMRTVSYGYLYLTEASL